MAIASSLDAQDGGYSWVCLRVVAAGNIWVIILSATALSCLCDIAVGAIASKAATCTSSLSL